MLLNHSILALLWIVYCVLHSLLAAVWVKKRVQKILGSASNYYRLLYTLVAFIFLVVVLYFQFTISTIELYGKKVPVVFIGYTIGVAGLVLMLVCIKKYFMSLSGIKSLFSETGYNSLLITGVHRYVRHPLYLGTFAFIWGLFLVKPFLSLLVANSIITIYTLIGIKLEENKLIAEFGESYKAYRQKVPMLLPFGKTQQGF